MRKLAAAALLFLPAIPRSEGAPQDDKLKLEYLEGVNLHEITIFVQRKTGYKFLWTEEIGLKNKKVYFRSKEAISDKDVIFRIYQSFLQVNDLFLVPVIGSNPTDFVFKIQVGATISKRPVPVEEGKVSPMDKVVTRVFPLKYVSPRDVHTALINMVSFPNVILPIESAGVLLITDYDYNIQRFERIIDQMDRPKPGIELRKVELRYALASDVAEMMTKLKITEDPTRFGGGVRIDPTTGARAGTTGGDRVQVQADKRTNSVIIVADVNIIDQVEKMVRDLDTETGFETSGIYIVHLKHTNAADLSRTLNSIYGISVDKDGVPTGSGGVRPGQPTGPSTTPTTTTSTSGGSSGPTGTEPKIVADARTNSIMIITDRNTFRQLDALIKRLDTRRPQVLIKATVVEVRSNDNFDFGVELARLADPDGSTELVGRTSFKHSTLTLDSTNNTFSITPIDTTGVTLAILKDKIGNIAAMLKASELKEKVSVLDEPEVTTADNGTAKMTLKNQEPTLTQSFVQGSGTPVTTFNKYEDAETTLQISPHISEFGYLRLETTIKIEKFVGVPPITGAPPPKATREITTNSILVPNGRTIVIGGIITQDDADTVEGVPILQHIPLLGLFFKRTVKKQQYRTLYIFITPYILYDEAMGDLSGLSKERRDEIERLRGAALSRLQLDGPPQLVPRSTYRFSRRRED